jgi:Flp pilus assembly protein TadG
VRSRSRADAGSVTAEFALALPLVVVVLAFCLTGLQVAGQQVRLQDAAATAARAAARGDNTAIAARLTPSATVSQWNDGALVCVRLTSATPVPGVTLGATSCALGGGK